MPPLQTVLKKATRLLIAWLVIILILYAALEASLVCCTSYLFPYATRVEFGFGIYPLLQTSKSGTTPENYTAIFGDSYGFGAGDGFSQLQYQSNPDFNVTHILHKEMKKDFISFAIPNSSNLNGWIEDPISSINYINSTLFYKIPLPSEILLYFYEGNDMDDDKRELDNRYIANGYDKERLNDEAYFDNFIEKEMLEKNRINMESKNNRTEKSFLLLSYAKNIATTYKKRNEIKKLLKEFKPPQPGEINKAIVNGKEINLPDNIASPFTQMTSHEKHDTLRFLDSITRYTVRKYPSSQISIIYIPSATSSYQLTSGVTSIYNPTGTDIIQTPVLREESNYLCRELKKIASSNNISFHDTRKDILEAGKKKLLHGPFDTGHFNLDGYKALSRSIGTFLKSPDYLSRKTIDEPCYSL